MSALKFGLGLPGFGGRRVIGGGGGGVPTSKPMAFASFECPTETGNIDILADMGGETPKLAIFMLTSHRFSQDPDASGGCFMAMSACTADDQVFSAAAMGSDQSTTSNRREIGSGNVCRIINTAASLISNATLVEFIPNGVRLNFTTTTSLAYTGIVWFFGGDDVDAAVGLLDVNGAAGARVVSGLGFEPNFLMTGHSGDNDAAGVQSSGNFLIGMADGTSQRSAEVGQPSVNASGACRQAVRDDCVIGLYSSTSGNLLWKAAHTSFDTGGFTLNMDTNPGASREIMWIALRLNGGEFGLIATNTPTATGNQPYTGMGFQPDAVMGWVTTQEALNPAGPLTASTTLAGGSGFFSFDTTQEWAASWCHGDDGLTVANGDLKAATLRLGDGSDQGTGAVSANLTSIGSNGFTLNYSAVLGTAKIGWALGIKKAA